MRNDDDHTHIEELEPRTSVSGVLIITLGIVAIIALLAFPESRLP